ncbi:4172_t:CDS:2 [Entrophospora sp. SA101]|nr:4172_t:CDS:2 [Entrophospora sp. SA101]
MEQPDNKEKNDQKNKTGKKPPLKKKTDAHIEGASQLGIEVRKEADFSTWYTQVLKRSEMLEYYEEVSEMGVEDTYFPMFVSQRQLEKEKNHVEGFAPEVAWVTKAGSSEMENPIAIRPTSETVMYPYFAKWIRTHRDLPLKPFIRTREFLWQEGHTAHFTKKEADDEVLEILELYRQVYEDLLAVPVIQGVKSEKEKFAGGLYTTTLEGFIPTTGRGIQAATSHCLGQNFSKMFDIVVEDPNSPAAEGSTVSKKLHVWQNSWGLTTRSIGVMVMIHGDDKGLVLPPKVASVQVIVIPCGITVKTSESDKKAVEDKVQEVIKQLKSIKVKAKADLRDNYSPGYKYNHWELRGVPLRIEIGPRDLASEQVLSIRRDTGVKEPIALSDLETKVPEILQTIQKDLLDKARKVYNEHVKIVLKWEDFVPTLDGKNLALIPWCENGKCEDKIKENKAEDDKAPSMGAKSLCIPFEQPKDTPIISGETKCVGCGELAKRYALFGRSY